MNIINYASALLESDLHFPQMVVWVKQHPVMNRKDFMGNQWCFYGWKEGSAHYFHPEIHNATDVWEVKKVNPQSMIHLTEKPVELAVRAMTYSSKPKENVLDLFGGSGSTLIAAEHTERKAFLMEIDPPYCDVIVKRWEQFTGNKPRLDGTARLVASHRRNTAKRGVPGAAIPGLPPTQKAPQGEPQGAEGNP